MILHEKEQKRLHRQARIDALTQDGNRYYFKDEIQKILRHHQHVWVNVNQIV